MVSVDKEEEVAVLTKVEFPHFLMVFGIIFYLLIMLNQFPLVAPFFPELRNIYPWSRAVLFCTCAG